MAFKRSSVRSRSAPPKTRVLKSEPGFLFYLKCVCRILQSIFSICVYPRSSVGDLQILSVSSRGQPLPQVHPCLSVFIRGQSLLLSSSVVSGGYRWHAPFYSADSPVCSGKDIHRAWLCSNNWLCPRIPSNQSMDTRHRDQLQNWCWWRGWS